MEQTFAHIRAALRAVQGSLGVVTAELVLAAAVLVLVIAAALDRRNRLMPWLSLAGVALSSGALLWQPEAVGLTWGSMLIVDQIGLWARGLLLFTGFVTLLWVAREPRREFLPEVYPLLLALLLGTLFMVMAANLLFMYLSLELVSISSYLLTVHQRQQRAAAEASLKYIIFGAFSSAFMLYGISWFYGLTGTLTLSEVPTSALDLHPVEAQLLVLGLIMVGILFKIAAVPLHFWAPDIYQGTTFPVATFFSIVPKTGGVMMLVHLLELTDGLRSHDLMQLLVLVVALASMTLGNLAALWQTDLKRLLAYSSIAQSGFMLVAAACRSETGEAAVLFYLTIYVLMNLSVFIIAAGLGRSARTEDLRELDGLAFRFPLPTIAITIGLVALVGLPPTSGFIAKWYVLMAGIEQVNGAFPTFWVITLALAVVNTVISLFYYLRIPARMVLRPYQATVPPLALAGWVWIGIIMAIPTLLLGVMGFDEIMNLIQVGLWNP